jgi:hypothetical protein
MQGIYMHFTQNNIKMHELAKYVMDCMTAKK